MAKVNRCGQSAILDGEQLDRLFECMNPKCRAALSVCRYTAARITEALALKWRNITPGFVVLEKANTKTKQTRQVPLHPRLHEELQRWRALHKREPSQTDWLFPRADGDTEKPTPRRTVDHSLRTACKRIGLQGVSTHSLRRSALTSASDKGVPLRHIQSLSGHASLDCLSKYLQVTDGQKRVAAMAFA